MATTEVVRARVDERLEKEATAILAAMELTVSDFVRIGPTRVVIEQGLPFEIRVPNQLIVETLTSSERGEDIHRAEDAKTLLTARPIQPAQIRPARHGPGKKTSVIRARRNTTNLKSPCPMDDMFQRSSLGASGQSR